MSDAAYAGAVRVVARRIVDARAATVLFDGPSGSGKSTFALAVLGALRALPGAPRAELVRMDDLYPGWSGLDAASDSTARDLVRPRAIGARARWRPWNWASGTTAGVREVRAPLLLLEGCGSASAPARTRADLTIWIEAEEGQRRRRALTRDGALFESHWDDWDAQFRRYCERERPREGADLVIDTSD